MYVYGYGKQNLLAFGNTQSKDGAEIVIFVPILLLYSRKVYLVKFRFKPNFLCLFMAKDIRSSLNLRIFRKKGRCNIVFVSFKLLYY